ENQYSEEVVDENRELSDEEKAELMKKYDSESNRRNMKGIAGAIVFILLLSFSIFELYIGVFGQFTAYIELTVYVGLVLTLIFMLYQSRKKKIKKKIPWYDIILILLAVIVTSYWPIFYETLVQQIGTITDLQIIIGGIAILLVLEAARRAVGLPITIIAILF